MRTEGLFEVPESRWVNKQIGKSSDTEREGHIVVLVERDALTLGVEGKLYFLSAKQHSCFHCGSAGCPQ